MAPFLSFSLPGTWDGVCILVPLAALPLVATFADGLTHNMPADTLFGLLAGSLIGAGNALASLLLYYRTRKRSMAIFYRNVFGGMFLRMTIVLVAVVLVIRLAPIDVLSFVGALFATFVVGLIIDIYLILRMSNKPDNSSS